MIFSPLYDKEFISLQSDSDDDDLDASFQKAIQASLDQAADGSLCHHRQSTLW